MMKLEIYDENICEVEKTVRFRLIRWFGKIQLVAVREDGRTMDSGHLISIEPDGTFKRCELVSKNIGLPLVESDKIKME